eukprot:c7734_g1_i1 orf=1-153(-)
MNSAQYLNYTDPFFLSAHQLNNLQTGSGATAGAGAGHGAAAAGDHHHHHHH